jgi:alkaline phosphatase D
VRRRAFVRLLSAGGATSWLGPLFAASGCSYDATAVPASTPEEIDRVFPQGVGSGDPSPDSIILWVRVEPDPGFETRTVDVRVQLSPDPDFELVIVDSVVPAGAEWDHTVRIRVGELSPGTTYHYRFVAQGVTSPWGRTRTAPDPDDEVDVRFAVASCQEYVGRWYHAWRVLLDEANEPDFVLFLGDYIYETVADPRYQSVGSERSVEIPDGLSLDGSETNLAALTVADYRAIYKAVRSDPDLREAHRLFPFVTIWDDHEFANDCWQDVANEFDGHRGIERDRDRREAASRAWFEFQAVDLEYDPEGSFPDDLAIERTLRWGAHCRLVLSDVRSHRDDHVVPEGPIELSVGKFAENSPLGARVFAYKEGFDALESEVAPTMLGEEQLQRTVTALQEASTTWTFWCQPLLVAQMLLDLRGFEKLPTLLRQQLYFKLDQWDGFRSERAQVLAAVAMTPNLVVLSGDLHGNYAAELRVDFDDPEAPATATELMVTGISSISLQEQLDTFTVDEPLLAGLGLEQVTPLFDETLRASSPHIRYANSSAFGYMIVEAGADDLRATFVELERVDDPEDHGRVERQPVRIPNGAARIEL